MVWWSWNYTTWVTDEPDTDSAVVRLMLVGVMLATFAMAVPRRLRRARAAVRRRLRDHPGGRHLFPTFAGAAPGTLERERAARILIWFAASGVFWIAGGVAEGDARAVLWLIGLTIDYAAPLRLHPVPGCAGWTTGPGRSPPTTSPSASSAS